MRKSMTSDALPHRGMAAPFRVAIGLALAASASVMLWVVGTHCVSASEFGRNAAEENRGFTRYPVAYLSVSASEFGRNAVGETPMTLEDRVAALTAELAQVKAETAKLKDEMLHLRLAQDDTATDIGSLRAGVANSEIGVDSLRATTGELRQQIERIEAARDATGSIAKSRKHQGHKKWVAQR